MNKLDRMMKDLPKRIFVKYRPLVCQHCGNPPWDSTGNFERYIEYPRFEIITTNEKSLDGYDLAYKDMWMFRFLPNQEENRGFPVTVSGETLEKTISKMRIFLEKNARVEDGEYFIDK